MRKGKILDFSQCILSSDTCDEIDESEKDKLSTLLLILKSSLNFMNQVYLNAVPENMKGGTFRIPLNKLLLVNVHVGLSNRALTLAIYMRFSTNTLQDYCQ